MGKVVTVLLARPTRFNFNRCVFICFESFSLEYFNIILKVLIFLLRWHSSILHTTWNFLFNTNNKIQGKKGPHNIPNSYSVGISYQSNLLLSIKFAIIFQCLTVLGSGRKGLPNSNGGHITSIVVIDFQGKLFVITNCSCEVREINLLILCVIQYHV